jgi:hypothetical protein
MVVMKKQRFFFVDTAGFEPFDDVRGKGECEDEGEGEGAGKGKGKGKGKGEGEGSTGGPLSPTRPAVPARARSPEAKTPNPHALKISRGGDGDPAALDGAFDAVQYVVGVKLIMKPPRASVQFINVTTLRAPSCHLT